MPAPPPPPFAPRPHRPSSTRLSSLLSLPPMLVPPAPPPLPPPGAPAVSCVPDAPTCSLPLPEPTILLPSISLPDPAPAPSPSCPPPLVAAGQPAQPDTHLTPPQPPLEPPQQLQLQQQPQQQQPQPQEPHPQQQLGEPQSQSQPHPQPAAPPQAGPPTQPPPHASTPPPAAAAATSSSLPVSSPASTTSKGSKKRPHKSISHAEKRRLCEIFALNPRAKHNHIASLFQSETGRRIERSTVTRVLQRKDFWLAAATKDANRKRLASPRFPTVEEVLYELIRNRALSASLRKRLGDKELLQHSKDIASTLRVEHGSLEKASPNYVPHLDSFRGSLSWLGSFRKRNGLASAEDPKLKAQNRRSFGKGFNTRGNTGDTVDIWRTQLDIDETKDALSNWTRFEDLYFLEATVLAAGALPEHAAEADMPSSDASMDSLNEDRAVDEALGIISSMHSDRNSGPGDLSGAAFPTINFALPPMPAVMGGPSVSAINSTSQEEHQAFGVQSDPFGGAPHVMDTTPNENTMESRHNESRHCVDEDSLLVALLCSNGIGNDRPSPWVIGKQPFRKVGSKEGEVWHDCNVRYFHNVRGWLTSRIVRKWIEEFDQSLDRSVALLTSLLCSSDLELMELKFVTIIPLARTEHLNDSSLAQQWRSTSSPIHQGIEETFRTKYRYLVLDKALQSIARDAAIKAVSIKSGATMIKEAWEKVPVTLIRRAWRDLSYLPGRLLRSSGQPRGSARTLTDQRVSELGRLIRSYRTALVSYSSTGRYHVRPCDLQVAVNDARTYIWLSAETSVFHPKAKIIDFVQSVCSIDLGKEPSSDDEMGADGEEKSFPRISNYGDALQAANELAEFMRNDTSLSGGQNLYLIGSVQVELKRLFDQKQNHEHTNAWSG